MSQYKNHDSATAYDKDGLPLYGLSAEVKARIDGKRDAQVEKDVQNWIENVIGEKFPKSFEESLKSGVILCKLANKIKPGIIAKVNTNNMPFMQMENIASFLKTLDVFGVNRHDQFQTVDLFEGKNIPQVTQSLFVLASSCQKLPYYKGPQFGIKIADKREINFTEDQLRQARNTVGQQYEGFNEHAKNTIGLGISKEIVKTNDTGDKKSVSQMSVASVAVKQDRSIHHEIIKTSETGDKRTSSQQTSGSNKVESQRSISNEVVKVPQQQSGGNSDLDAIAKLADLRDKGILTEPAFQAKQKQILGL